MRLTIRNLKKDLWAEAEEKHTFRPKTVEYFIQSPTSTKDLAMSAPHRFLTLALRRGALEGIETIQDLLEGPLRHIRVKPEFLDKPVLLAGGRRGLSVLPDTPVTALALNEYITLRGRKAGYPLDVTFYSIRKRAATDFTRALGADTARDLMNHDPDTKTLEKFYVNLRPFIDVSAVTLGQPQQVANMELESHHLALNKLSDQGIADMFGPELNALTRQLVESDEVYPALDEKGKKNRKRHLRLAAFNAIRTKAHEAQAQTMTTHDMAARKENVSTQSTWFNDTLLKLAKQNSRTLTSEPDVSAMFDEDFQERGAVDDGAPEQDIEDQIANGLADATQPIVVGVERLSIDSIESRHRVEDSIESRPRVEDSTESRPRVEDSIESQIDITSIDYQHAVKAAMEILLHNPLSDELVPLRTMVHCPLCLEDETLSPELQEKKFQKGHLSRHLKGNFHSGYETFSRAAKLRHAETGWFDCPYCAEARPNDVDMHVFSDKAQMIRHIRRSNEDAINVVKDAWAGRPEAVKAHDQAKRLAGWYDDDFKGDLEHKQQRREDFRQLAKRDYLMMGGEDLSDAEEGYGAVVVKDTKTKLPLPPFHPALNDATTTPVDHAAWLSQIPGIMFVPLHEVKKLKFTIGSDPEVTRTPPRPDPRAVVVYKDKEEGWLVDTEHRSL